MKYTKGNWKILPPSNFANRRGLSANDVKHTVIEDYTSNYEEAEANAKLIAAAPNLLESLQEAQAWIIKIRDTMKEGSELHNILSMGILKNQQSIDKATGKESSSITNKNN